MYHVCTRGSACARTPRSVRPAGNHSAQQRKADTEEAIAEEAIAEKFTAANENGTTEGYGSSLMKTDRFGKFWCRNRDGDLPAVVMAGGDQYWYRNGTATATDQEYWRNGERHHDGNEPADVYANDDWEWFRIGGRDRYWYGDRYQYGERRRDDP